MAEETLNEVFEMITRYLKLLSRQGKLMIVVAWLSNNVRSFGGGGHGDLVVVMLVMVFGGGVGGVVVMG